MKKQKLLIAALAMAVAAVGCKKTEQVSDYPATPTNEPSSLSVTQQWQNAKEVTSNAWQNTKEATTNAMASVKEGAADAWAKTKEVTASAAANVKEAFQSDTATNYSSYVYAQKDAFVTKAKADLAALDVKIKELSDKAASATGTVKDEIQTKLQDLSAKRTDLDKKFDAVKDTAEDKWDDAKAGFQKAYDDVKDSFKQAWDWLGEKLNP